MSAMSERTDRERRRDPRARIARSAKLQCAVTGRYYQGCTQDVSSGGAMLEINHPSLMVVGQQLRVGIAWTNRHALIRRDEMIPARVTRSLGIEGRQRVAVQFETPQELALTG
ncbi:MAG: hypothetical protein CMJ18_28055 [Phycisphaeraceae bacterium]|nr:hypothetical protein [Phycisphaeraceae bacterium]